MNAERISLGKAIQKAACTLGKRPDFLRPIADVALEQHVFDKMEKASFTRGFMSGTVGKPDGTKKTARRRPMVNQKGWTTRQADLCQHGL